MSFVNSVTYRIVLGWLIACTVLVLSVVAAIKNATFIPTDYGSWQADWHTAIYCLAQGFDSRCHGVSKFPLAYLINAGLAGSSGGREHLLLTIANTTCLFLPFLALLLTEGPRKLLRAGWVYVAAIALSPLPMFYVATGAMEVQSAIFCGLYIGTFARTLASPGLRANAATTWLLVFSGFVFPLYKDTIAGFMGIAMIILVVLHRSSLFGLSRISGGRARLARVALFAAAPVLLSQLIDAAYCWFKYGVPIPMGYIDEAMRTSPTFHKSTEFLLGSMLSPNGGVFVFWGLPFFVAIMGWRAVGLVPRRQVVIGALGFFFVCVMAFAHWWATFGWDSWGNRLMVPASFAMLVAALLCLRLRTVADEEQTVMKPVVVAYVPLLMCSAYYVFIPYAVHAPQLMQNSLWYGPACARMRAALSTEAITQGLAFWKSNAYYECARERMLHVPGP